jgi:hypothetical protein
LNFGSVEDDGVEKREAGGQGEFIADFNIFLYQEFVFSDVLNQVVVFFFAPHAPACRRSFQCR